MEFQQYQSLSYLVRIWRDSREGGWRASATNIGDQEERQFPSLENLFKFLTRQSEQSNGRENRAIGIPHKHGGEKL